MLRIDHVVYATADLHRAGERFLDEFGLASVPGGTHPGWGTANRIVPLGTAYVELLAVVDLEVAEADLIGRGLLELTEAGDGWYALCLADDDIDATADRLGLAVTPGSRVRPDGATVKWRGAGFAETRTTPELPFFITWDVPPSLHPGAAGVGHPSGATSVARVEIAGDREAFDRWVGGADLPVDLAAGSPQGVRAVVLATPDGEQTIR